MNDINQYYEILGLKPGASQAEVKQAYRNLAKTWHPDRFPNANQLKYQAEEEIKKINEAYEQLKSYQPGSLNQTSQTGITSTNSSDAEIYYNQGMENAKRGRYQEAINKFTIAIRLNPNYVEAYKYRGLACSKLGYENRARSDLKKATELELKQRKTEPPSASSPSTPLWRCIYTLTAHSNWVNSIAISPDGQQIASGSYDETIKLWQLRTGKQLAALTGHHKLYLVHRLQPRWTAARRW